ncbi:MAG TPA: alpha/beta fold hydrolase [Verrucomicrobiota bacterium]|nr:alpha/beta fold hydrolase [Verrucomicrobiota bacterium]
MSSRAVWLILPWLLLAAGCSPGRFVARQMAKAPNSHPTFFAPNAPITLALGTSLWRRLPEHWVEVGPPPASLVVRIFEPGDYGLTLNTTNWTEGRRQHLKLDMVVKFPPRPLPNHPEPRGTIVLLHGYGIALDAMAPWGFLLAEEGWRCVLVNLRGHGRSTGGRIHYGPVEARDLAQALDALERRGLAAGPFGVMGVSDGAGHALRWAGEDPRLAATVAVTPYAELAAAALNIRDEYARWLPRGVARSGTRHLPGVLAVDADELNPSAVLARRPVRALFVAGDADRITPADDIRRLLDRAAPGSALLLVPEAGHEAAPYFFEALRGPVTGWFAEELSGAAAERSGAWVGGAPPP